MLYENSVDGMRHDNDNNIGQVALEDQQPSNRRSDPATQTETRRQEFALGTCLGPPIGLGLSAKAVKAGPTSAVAEKEGGSKKKVLAVADLQLFLPSIEQRGLLL